MGTVDQMLHSRDYRINRVDPVFQLNKSQNKLTRRKVASEEDPHKIYLCCRAGSLLRCSHWCDSQAGGLCCVILQGTARPLGSWSGGEALTDTLHSLSSFVLKKIGWKLYRNRHLNSVLQQECYQMIPMSSGILTSRTECRAWPML